MSPSPIFTTHDKQDLLEFYRIYDFSKWRDVDRIVAATEAAGTTPLQLFRDLYDLHSVACIADRSGAASRLQAAAPAATGADVESALRLAEMKGLAESDALQALQRKFGERRIRSPVRKASRESPAEISIEKKQLNSGPTRAAIDEVMTEECREWVAKVVGDAYNHEVLSETNFVDALRSGVVLMILLQKLQDPPVPDAELKIPKRSTGFYARDNVISFLQAAAHTFDLCEAQLFTDSDLCDGKNDRFVVTCLVSIARKVYKGGTDQLTPAFIVYEQEIDSKLKQVSQADIDRIVDSHVEEENAIEESEKDTESEVEMEATSRETETLKEYVEEEVESVNNEETPVPDDETAATEEQVITEVLPEHEYREKQEVNSRGKTFYIRNGLIGTDTQCMHGPTPPPAAKTQKASVEAPAKSRRPQSSQAPPKYHSHKSDDIDVLLGIIVNTHFVLHPFSKVRFRRLAANSGEYVAYNRSSGDKRLLYVRILQRKLVVRQAKSGNLLWADFKEWLSQYECETSS